MTMTIEISNYKSSKHYKSLNRADAHEGDKGFDGRINTEGEVLKAAELICGTKEGLAAAEGCLRKALNIKAAKIEAEAGSKGAEIKSASPIWGKSGLKTTVSSGVLKIAGSLNDSELYTVRLASPISVPKGKTLAIDIEADGSFVWGGKVMAFEGFPKPNSVSNGRIDKTDSNWVVIGSGEKGTVTVRFSDEKSVSSIPVKTGGMESAYIKISNIRVQ